ncbi:MAG: type II toxin-antitoxin system Phd/YefM family antitoxin [Pyrinomonadaceae bacterium]
MKKFSVFEGKNKFSEVVTNAANGEPQVITKNGKETAVVISYADYKKLTAPKKSFVDFLLDNPARKYGMDLDLTRDNDAAYREVDLSDE